MCVSCWARTKASSHTLRMSLRWPEACLFFRDAGRSSATALSAATASSYWPRAERRLISRWVICCIARHEYCRRDANHNNRFITWRLQPEWRLMLHANQQEATPGPVSGPRPVMSGGRTSSPRATRCVMSLRQRIILSSLKSYGNVSVHSVRSCTSFGATSRKRIWGQIANIREQVRRGDAITPGRYNPAHLIQQGVSGPLLLHAQVTHPGHELVRVQEEAGAQQEGEHVRSLMRRKSKGRQSAGATAARLKHSGGLRQGSSPPWEPGAGSAPPGMPTPNCCHGNTSRHSSP